MKLAALLTWYNESPDWLAALVASLHPIVDHLVAVDGAYVLFPDAISAPRSGSEQARALAEVTDALGMGLTLHTPNEPFVGNEVEKRNLMFDLARCVTDEDDWWLHIDGDERVRVWPIDTKKRLEASEWDAATVTSVSRPIRHPEPGDEQAVAHFNPMPLRTEFGQHYALTRALRDLRVVGVHYHYVTGDDTDENPLRWLRAEASHQHLQSALNMEDLRIEHLHDFRQGARNDAAASYYKRRDDLGVERMRRVLVRSADGGWREPTRPSS